MPHILANVGFMGWTGLAQAVFVAAQAVILFVAAIWAAKQLRETKNQLAEQKEQVREQQQSRRAAAVLPTYERMHGSVAREQRRVLYHEIAPRFPVLSDSEKDRLDADWTGEKSLQKEIYKRHKDEYPLLSHKHQLILEEVIAELQFLGYAVRQGLIEPDQVSELYHGTVLRCWRSCRMFVIQQEISRKTKYAWYFREFYEICLEYGKQNQLPDPATSDPSEGPSPRDTQRATAYNGRFQLSRRLADWPLN